MKAGRLRKKKELVERFGGECSECGFADCLRALSFHHKDPYEKEFGLSSDNLMKAWDTVVAEAQKCELLCANCHAQHHCDVCGDDPFEL